MKQKFRPLLIPQYMNNFSCLGSSCEDTCCSGFRVDVDQLTYKKYKKVRHSELSPLLEKKITRNRVNPTFNTYAKINISSGESCDFLNQDGLCRIQSELGESFLCNTCSIYPRTINKINDVVEKSLTLSCPEAARLVLLNPMGIEFDQTEEIDDSSSFFEKQIHTQNNDPTKYFWDLRIFTIQVLQDRSYGLEERLMILGLFYKKVQNHIDDSNIDLIPETIETFIKLMANQGMKSSFENVSPQYGIQMELCKELLEERFTQGVASSRYIECLTETFAGLNCTNDTNIEEMIEKYKGAYVEYFTPFIDEHEYILENYLVNHVFRKVFPAGTKSVFDEYVMIIIQYALIKLHLIGVASYNKELTIDLVIKLIQSFSKTIEHNLVYLSRIYNLLKKNEMMSLPYMMILIKN